MRKEIVVIRKNTGAKRKAQPMTARYLEAESLVAEVTKISKQESMNNRPNKQANQPPSKKTVQSKGICFRGSQVTKKDMMRT